MMIADRAILAVSNPNLGDFMPFSLASLKNLNLTDVKTDLAKVEDVLAVVAKYEGELPLPASVGVVLADLQKVLAFAVSVLSEV